MTPPPRPGTLRPTTLRATIPRQAGPPAAEFATTDPERAHAFLRSSYADNTMRIIGSAEGFRMTHSVRDAGPVSVAVMLHTMGVEHVAEPTGRLLVCRVLDGRIERRTAGEVTRAGRDDIFLASSPELPYAVRWERLRVQIVTLDLALLADVAGEFGGRAAGPPRFASHQPSSAAAGRYCGRLIDLLASDLPAHPQAAASPLLATTAARGLAAAVLSAFPGSYLDGRAAPDPVDRAARSPVTLRRAVEFIDAHAHRPIGLADVAAAVHVTSRTVQLAFRHHLDTTPTAYLRRVRLDHAHRELLAADPTGDATVTAVASRWGFHHPGRFAAAYRHAYGCSPRQTLQRAGRGPGRWPAGSRSG